MPATTDAFVFDLYGTLLDVRSVVTQVSAVLGGRGDASRLLDRWRQAQLEYTWHRALMKRYADFEAVTRDGLDYAAAEQGLELDRGARQALVAVWDRLAPYAEVPATLDRLAPTPRAVLSNGSPAMLGRAVAASGLAPRLGPVLSVDAVQTYKPSPAVYRHAAETLGLRPERITFVSSNAWDAAGAKAFGFRTVWVNRAGAPFARLGVRPDVEARDLTRLLEAA